MDNFITGDIWSEVNKRLTKQQNKTACIAYVTTDNLELSEGDILICDASNYAIKHGQTAANVLKTYYEKGVKVLSNQQMHSKMLLTDKFLVIGSANLSKNSAERLIESAIFTESDILISQAKAFCHNLKEESTLLYEEDILRLLDIEVVKQPYKPIESSNVREKKFGDKYWYAISSPLSERVYSKIKDDVEITTKLISKSKKIDEDNIGLYRLKLKTKFSELVKEGDQLIFKEYNEKNTQSYICPPSTVLKKEIKDGFIYLYHDVRDANEKKLSWTKFQKKIKGLKLEKGFPKQTGQFKEDYMKKLKPIWNL